ncbi:MAG TPA: response regulator transcription factor [Geobacteraceae bacterium]|nr:response regulator transcription factor [Geobacteraceae bacterium]
MDLQNKVRIFLADDHPLLRMGLRLAFEAKENIEVVGESDNGFDAIDCIKKLVPDVALMDIDMPGLSGTAAIRMLRKIFPDMKILALSTYNDRNYVMESMGAGADGYLLKTVDMDNLTEIIVAFHEGKEIISPYLLNLGMDLNPAHTAERAETIALTRREEEILRCLADGKNNKEISASLFLSIETVKTHLKGIFKKLGTRSRLEAVMKARKKGLIG